MLFRSELVVPSGPASGLDTAMRSMKNLLDNAKLIGASSIVVNKAGAGGTIAYQYINQRPGNVRYLALASPSLITNRMMGVGDLDHRDVTPVCRLFSDNIVFMVRADSSIGDGRALIARLRANPSAASFGIATAMGGANHIAAAAMLKDAGIDIKAALYVGYKSGADALIALLSGDVDVVPVAAPVSLPQLAAGKVRVIAVSSRSGWAVRSRRCRPGASRASIRLTRRGASSSRPKERMTTTCARRRRCSRSWRRCRNGRRNSSAITGSAITSHRKRPAVFSPRSGPNTGNCWGSSDSHNKSARAVRVG